MEWMKAALLVILITKLFSFVILFDGNELSIGFTLFGSWTRPSTVAQMIRTVIMIRVPRKSQINSG